MSSLKNQGQIFADAGAIKAVKLGKSLLPVGIIDIKGKFSRGDTVLIYNKAKSKVGTGVVSYSSDEILKIKGKKSDQIKKILGYSSRGEVIHIDNMVLS